MEITRTDTQMRKSPRRKKESGKEMRRDRDLRKKENKKDRGKKIKKI